MTISEAFAAYEVDALINKPSKTKQNYRVAMNSLLRTCEDLPVQFINHQSILQWKKDMLYRGNGPASIASNLSRLKQILRYLKRHEYSVMDSDIIERPTVKQKDPVWLTIEELSRFLSVITSPRDKALFACLFSSGARISELLSLDRGSIKDGLAAIRGKGDKPGVLQFDSSALALLGAYLDTRKDKLRPLFISSQHRRITVSRVAQVCHEYADLAGLDKNVTTHIFRHTFASDLKLNGADIYDIKEQLRHDRLSSTQIYVHIGEDKRRADYQRHHTKVPLV